MKRSVGVAFVTSAIVASAMAVVVAVPGTAAAGINADRAQMTQIEQRIAAQGAQAQALVVRYDQAIERDDAIKAEIVRDQARLAADRRSENQAMLKLRRAAIDAYTTGGWASSPTLDMFAGLANATQAMEQSEYLHVADGNLNTALASWKVDQNRTSQAQAVLVSEHAQATATVRQLAQARGVAEAAIASDETLLGQVSGNLQSLVAAANQKRRLAAQRAAEQALAAKRAAAQQAAQSAVSPSASLPPPVQFQPAPGGYVNPLRAIGGLMPERVDQGVDYGGFGPIYAIGDGVVLNTVNAGWPGGTFITYRLTNGPAAGLVVYAAEDIYPSVSVGQAVTAGTVLGQMYDGPDGIETGWAGRSGQGYTMAHDYGQFYGANSTAFGYNFSQLLQSLGAPGGVLQNNPPTGTLPPGWPQW
ncbi:MAG: hypothetical protein ACYCTL_01040 [Acidimicrobiales bacterium]